MTLQQAYRFWFWRDFLIMLSTLLALGALIYYQNHPALIVFVVYATLLFLYQVVFPKVMLVMYFIPGTRSWVLGIPGWVYPTDSWLSMGWQVHAIETQVMNDVHEAFRAEN